MTTLTPHRNLAALALRELGYPNNNLHVYYAGYDESINENCALLKSKELVSYYIITDDPEINERNVEECFFDKIDSILRKKNDKKNIKTNKKLKRIEVRLSKKETALLSDFWCSAEFTKDMVERLIDGRPY